MKKGKYLVLAVALSALIFGCENMASTPKDEETLTLIGTWSCNENTYQDRKLYEVLTYKSDGTYTIRGEYLDTKEFLASGEGTFTYTKNTITYTTDPDKLKTETYVISQKTRTLTLTTKDNAVSNWKREK